MIASHPEIRLLTPGEAALYRDIRLEALKRDPDAFSSTFERENAMPLKWFEERIVNGNVFGAFAGGELVGVAGYWRQEGAKVRHKAGFGACMFAQRGAAPALRNAWSRPSPATPSAVSNCFSSASPATMRPPSASIEKRAFPNMAAK
jgi:hypothetical protein